MTWFKVDDRFAFHPKAIAAGNAALGLWLRAGAWCSGNLTDGALPRHMIGTLGAQRRDALRLVSAGLWCETTDGFQFNGWTEWQPTKQQVTADREAAKARQQAFRDRRRNGVTNGVTDTVTHGVTNAAPTRPDPTRTSNEVREEPLSGEPDDEDPDPGPGFADFYAAYPRKEARRRAEQAWRAACKRATPTQILEGLARFPFRDERQYQPLPASWLNADRWTDETTTPPALALIDGKPAHLPGDVVANLIGPDVWSPPRGPDGMTSDELWEWNRQRQIEHIADRQARARAKLAAGA